MESRTKWLLTSLAAIVLAVVVFYGVQASRSMAGRSVPAVPGSPVAGAEALRKYGCGTCHTIPGVPRARGKVGPPLAGVAERQFLAGMLRNTPENMRRWIMNPQLFAPGTAMPDMGVSEGEARDIVAYLQRLR